MSVSTVGESREPTSPPAGAAAAPPAAALEVVHTTAAAAAAASDRSWVWHVTLLSVALGAMLALAVRTTYRIRNAGLPGNRMGISAALLSAIKDENVRQQDTIEQLNKKLRAFENSITDQDKSVELLKKQFQEVKALSGLTPVQGPGLRIILRDSREARLPGLSPAEEESYMVHDQDLNGVINELKAAGAEALAIAGADGKSLQRVIVTTTARCVGPTAVVNGASLSPPYTILVIGNPKNLRNALEMPNGFIQMRSLDVLKMIEIEESEHLVLPEFAGSLSLQYARPAPPNP